MCNFQAKWEWAVTPVFLQTYRGNRQPHHNALNFPVVPYPCSGSHDLWHVSAFCRTNVTFTQISTKYCVTTPYHACKKKRKKKKRKLHARFTGGGRLHRYTCTCAGTFLQNGRGRLLRTLRYYLLKVAYQTQHSHPRRSSSGEHSTRRTPETWKEKNTKRK